MPGFSETNVSRLVRHAGSTGPGRREEIHHLITTGYDSFSKLTLDQITRKVKDTKDVTIFPISVGQIARIMGYAGNRGRGAFMPANWIICRPIMNEEPSPRSPGCSAPTSPSSRRSTAKDFQDIGNDIRNQYSLSYHPTNTRLETAPTASLKVEVLMLRPAPSKVKDQKGKSRKSNSSPATATPPTHADEERVHRVPSSIGKGMSSLVA